MIVNALSIAGTDPTGGAGMHGDLKTFGALGAYGMGVVTAVVAQNTTSVASVHVLDPALVALQLDSVFDDVRVDSVKIGMLGSREIVRAVAGVLRRHRPPHVVLDPVMAATTGGRLLDPEAVSALRQELLPLVDLITPNLAEAARLVDGTEVVDEEGMAGQVAQLGSLGPAVLLKGGHLAGGESPDLLFENGRTTRLGGARVATRNTHGTGCALAAAIAALRPRRRDWLAAVSDAKHYVTAALRASQRLDVGRGRGPVHHFHAVWSEGTT